MIATMITTTKKKKMIAAMITTTKKKFSIKRLLSIVPSGLPEYCHQQPKIAPYAST